MSGSVQMAQSLEPASDSVSPSVSTPLLLALSVSLSLSKINIKIFLLIIKIRGVWVAQSVEHPTLDFSSGRDSRIVGSSPALSSTLTVEPA